jgi:hypothetical protein
MEKDAMDTKEAIAAAKQYIKNIYADEQVTNLGLEEVEHVLARLIRRGLDFGLADVA